MLLQSIAEVLTMTTAESYSTKSQFAYGLVRDRILAHQYGPGQVLNQATLAKELGISTTPLREALRRLSTEGLVELQSHRDARVTDLSSEEARDLVEIRLALDPLAASLAAQRRTREDIAELRAAATGMVPLPNDPALSQLIAHRRFHRAIYLAAHNDILAATLDGLWDKADRYRLVGLQVPRDQPERDERASEHQLLLDSIIAGDGELAAETMRKHIGASLGAKAAFRLGVPGSPTPTV
ncbi:GntR family transcriptional regulator [Naasia sp. SYSU D00057]|uniref:GntR family transcriptional regulator n=1 Tax=Naasia sp. SYSU D00057 TaxID=2817380 RepID=UPI001FEDD94F|nr:GntR family transcriptional regulator [Naasia sp. SYSU D00057]